MPRVVRETFVQERHHLSIGISSTRIESVKRQHTRKVGVRAYDGRRISIAGGLGFPDTDLLWKNAVDGLPDGIGYPIVPQTDHVESLNNVGREFIQSELAEEIQIILSHFRSKYPDLIFSGKAHFENYSASLKNDSGLDLSFSTPLFRYVMRFKQRNSCSIFDGGSGTFGVNFDRNSVIKDLEQGCSGYHSFAELKKKKKLPVVLSLGYENFVLRKVLENLSSVSVFEGTSVFSPKRKELELSPDFSLLQASDSANTGFKFFDYEGTVNPNHSLTLINKGKAVRFLSDRLMAGEYGCMNSGSAFRGKYDTVPSMGLPYVQVASTGRTIKEITAGRDAVLVLMVGGGGATTDGQISFPVNLSYLLRDGEVVGRLPQINISSSVWKMFNEDYMGCSSDSLLSLSHFPAVVCEMDVEPI